MPAMILPVDALCEAIASRAEEIERLRRLPNDLAAQLKGDGYFRLLLPKAIGGLEADPASFLRTVMTIGAADASTAWCVMIGATAALAAAYMPVDAASAIFGDHQCCASGVFAPMGRADVRGDGFELTGHWSWASGSSHATWFGGGALVMRDGVPLQDARGRPVMRMFWFPIATGELIDTWHVNGLAGSGSGDVRVERLFVPGDHVVDLVGGSPHDSGALYRFPVFGLLALGIAAVALGNAEGALRDLRALAKVKKPLGSTRALSDRATMHAELAGATAELDAARTYVFAVTADAWRKVLAGDSVDIDDRARLRLAATHATRTSARVVQTMYGLGGGSALFLSNPLQRRFRDAFAVTQHAMVAPPTLELIGRQLMGLTGDYGQM